MSPRTDDNYDARDVFVHDLLTRETTRVSVASDGTEGNDVSFAPDLSANGNIVGYGSYATNLVAGDTTGAPDQDVFVHDRTTQITTRINLAPNGDEAPGTSDVTIVSADGNYIAYGSAASNLVANDTNGHADVFIYDRALGETSFVSTTAAGVQGNSTSFNSNNSLSSDARFVLFRSNATNFSGSAAVGFENNYVRDRMLGTLTLVSHTSDGDAADNGTASPPSISGDGRFVTFTSYATNILPTGDVPGAEIFIPGACVLNEAGDLVTFDTDDSRLVLDDLNNTYDVFATSNPLF